jgi:hypothetical protein
MDDEKHQTFYAEFECYQESTISQRLGPWHFEIPGSHITKEQAHQEYLIYEAQIKKRCADKFPKYMFYKILNKQELDMTIKNLRLMGRHQSTIITIKDL